MTITVLQATRPTRCVLFAAGRGGHPARHMGLLQALVDQGMTVVAPHFDMLASPIPTKAELLERAHRSSQAVADHCPHGLPLAGVGHSIGTVVLLLLVGAHAETFAGDRVQVAAPPASLDRLVLMAPPTDFFRRAGALASVQQALQVWAGTKDTVTPPAQAEFLREAVSPSTPVDVRVVEGAGHFSFMDELPPHITDPFAGRAAFLRSLREEVSGFLAV